MTTEKTWCTVYATLLSLETPRVWMRKTLSRYDTKNFEMLRSSGARGELMKKETTGMKLTDDLSLQSLLLHGSLYPSLPDEMEYLKDLLFFSIVIFCFWVIFKR